MFGKIFERVIFNNFFDHFIKTKLLQNISLVFFKATCVYLSCRLLPMGSIHWLIVIQVLMIDISFLAKSDKTFDKVWHLGLLHKLEGYGVKENISNLLSNYLHKRNERVVLPEQMFYLEIYTLWCTTRINIRPTSF